MQALAVAESWPRLVAAKRSVEFAVTADANPQVNLRVLNYFAQRDLVPVLYRARRLRDRLEIRVVVDDMDEHVAAVVAEKIRQQFAVVAVEFEVVVGG